MRGVRIGFVAFSAVLAGAAGHVSRASADPAISRADPAPPISRANPAPITFRHFSTDITLAEDGSAILEMHLEAEAGNEGGARNIATQYFNYNDALETLELREAYTLKPDGRRLPVAANAIRTQLAPGAPGLPMYTDMKRMVAVLPDVQAGDTVAVTWRKTVLKPIFPGNFAQTSVFSRLIPWEDARIRITAPLDRPLGTEAFGPALTVREADGLRTYSWTYTAPAVAEDPAVIAPIDRAPRLFASTFKDWPDFGQAWAALVEPKRAVTPSIQAAADRITDGIDGERAQAEAIYAWVNRNIRWVALYVGDGTFIPHAADDVLAAGYGDCKDQVVLTVALLNAKAIAAEPVLINLGPSYRLSGPPTYTAFNHAITYLSSLDLYLDTTARGAPFGTLPLPLYGKPTLHARLEHAEIMQIPVLAPGIATMRQETVATLDPNGTIVGSTTMQGTGPFATALRGAVERFQSAGPQRAAAEQLRALGETGTGDIDLPALSGLEPEFHLSGRFALNRQADILDGDNFRMPPGLALLPHPGDRLLGLLALSNLPVTEPMPCYAGEQAERMQLTLPPGRKLTKLPRDRRLETADFSYASHWSVAEGVVTAERTLTSRVTEPLCSGKLRMDAARLLNLVRRDQDARLSLDEE